MGGKKNLKEDDNVNSAEEIESADNNSSGEEEGDEDYVVERVLDKRLRNGKVINFFSGKIFKRT